MTLASSRTDPHHVPCVLCARERCGCDGGGKGLLIQKEKTGAIATSNDQFVLTGGAVCIGNGQVDQLRVHEKVGALNCMHDQQAIIDDDTVVRRLTPLECERLQGFPDGWTDIGEYIDTNGKKRKTSDTARYKALGNSIALPFWRWMLERVMENCNEKTMASLFDGIGGFPLIWQELGGKAVWASEIEEFPIAVTKYHFGDD